MPAKRASTAATRAPRAANKTSASPASKAANAGTASKSSGASPTVTLRHLAVQIAEQHEMSKKMADAVLANMVNLMVKHLKKGDRVRIGGLGILQVKKRAARMGRNPATGEAIKIKASKKVAFRAAKELKESI
ncbi:MAG: HU family DNA-binding protein [Acetobacteraceae bacterium]|nr:HU family DNA-binding protein [Acetobacteraceae bacterium]